MSDSLNDNERLLIRLESQVKNSNDNQEKIVALTSEIFNKLDSQSKDFFDIKSKLEVLKETSDLKLMEVRSQISDINLKIDSSESDTYKIEKDLKEFKANEFAPLVNEINTAKGAIAILKYVYPTVALILQVIAIIVVIYFKK